VTGFKIDTKSKNTSEESSASGVFEMLVGYVKQQTLKPIKGAGRWIVFGFLAALSLSIGVVLGAIGILRLAQALLFKDSTSWSWASYLIALAICVAVLLLTVSKIRKGTLEKS
jgi:MFS family permease